MSPSSTLRQSLQKPILDPSLYRVEFKAMASACEVVVAAANEREAYRCIKSAIDEVQRIEKKYSRYHPDSIVSIINSSAGKDWVLCDDETESLLNYAGTLFNISDGLFDITSGILRQAWNFNHPVLPSHVKILDLLKLVGWQKVERENQKIRLPKTGMEIDFGGFGKEYAADRAATILVENGVKHCYVNLGGDLRAIGAKPTGEPWVMGILNPREKGAIIASIPLTVGALATSGDYEKFFDLNGKRYCHIISPRTGQPVTYWQSVSVLAPLAVNAGTYTTIAMLKEADGLAWLESFGLAYLAIDCTGQVFQKQA
jgi:thiamine biosynthesis lipoprotein